MSRDDVELPTQAFLNQENIVLRNRCGRLQERVDNLSQRDAAKEREHRKAKRDRDHYKGRVEDLKHCCLPSSRHVTHLLIVGTHSKTFGPARELPREAANGITLLETMQALQDLVNEMGELAYLERIEVLTRGS